MGQWKCSFFPCSCSAYHGRRRNLITPLSQYSRSAPQLKTVTWNFIHSTTSFAGLEMTTWVHHDYILFHQQRRVLTYAECAEYEHVMILRVSNGCCRHCCALLCAFCVLFADFLLRIIYIFLHFCVFSCYTANKKRSVHILRIFSVFYVFFCVFCIFFANSVSLFFVFGVFICDCVFSAFLIYSAFLFMHILHICFCIFCMFLCVFFLPNSRHGPACPNQVR